MNVDPPHTPPPLEEIPKLGPRQPRLPPRPPWWSPRRHRRRDKRAPHPLHPTAFTRTILSRSPQPTTIRIAVRVLREGSSGNTKELKLHHLHHLHQRIMFQPKSGPRWQLLNDNNTMQCSNMAPRPKRCHVENLVRLTIHQQYQLPDINLLHSHTRRSINNNNNNNNNTHCRESMTSPSRATNYSPLDSLRTKGGHGLHQCIGNLKR